MKRFIWILVALLALPAMAAAQNLPTHAYYNTGTGPLAPPYAFTYSTYAAFAASPVYALPAQYAGQNVLTGDQGPYYSNGTAWVQVSAATSVPSGTATNMAAGVVTSTGSKLQSVAGQSAQLTVFVPASGIGPIGNGVAGANGGNGTTASAAGANLNVDYTQNVLDTRWVWFNNKLSPSTNTTNIWEQSNSFLEMAGPGQANGEINLTHQEFELDAGLTAVAVEDQEAQLLNFGSGLGSWTGTLYNPNNESTGVAQYIYDVQCQLINGNSTAASIGVSACIDQEAMTGGGSYPTYYYFIRQSDSHAYSAFLGDINIGQLGDNGNKLYIQGPDTNSGTFPVFMKNSGGTNLFFIGDDGEVYVPSNTLNASVGLNAIGAAITLNQNSNFSTSINTGSSTGTVTLGNSSNTGKTVLAGLATGTNADFLCLSAGNVVLLQASSCTISSERFKTDINPFTGDALSELNQLEVRSYRMKEKNRDPNGDREQIGIIAESVAKVEPKCAIYEDDLKTPKSYRPECITALLVAAAQEHVNDTRRQFELIYALMAGLALLTLHAGHLHLKVRKLSG